MRFHEIVNEAAEPEFSNATYSNFAELKQAIAKEWQYTGELTRNQISRKGSQFGVTLGRANLLNDKGKVVGFWEVTSADKVPGRGLVTAGYGKLALKPKRKPRVAKEPAAPKVAKPSGPASASDLSLALSSIRQLMRAEDRMADFRDSNQTSFDVRYWGQWEVPADEEDDGDYDWKVISDETAKKIKSLIASVEASYPSVKVEVTAGEKEWLYVNVRSKL